MKAFSKFSIHVTWPRCGFALLLFCSAVLNETPGVARQRGEGAAKADNKKVEDKLFPTGAHWILSELNGKPVDGEPPTLTLDDQLRGTGHAGCNNFSAALYPLRGMRLAMGPIALTRKTCPAPRLALEHAYLTILHSGPSWTIEQSDLIIKGPAGSLRFKRGL